MSGNGAMLEVRGVTKRFGGVTALDGVSLDVGGGELLEGGISPGGHFAVLGGPNTAGTDPAFFFLVRVP